MKKTYYYHGLVTENGKVLERNWEGKTQAVSEKRAKSNLAYQFKQENNLPSNAKIELPDNVVSVFAVFR